MFPTYVRHAEGTWVAMRKDKALFIINNDSYDGITKYYYAKEARTFLYQELGLSENEIIENYDIIDEDEDRDIYIYFLEP